MKLYLIVFSVLFFGCSRSETRPGAEPPSPEHLVSSGTPAQIIEALASSYREAAKVLTEPTQDQASIQTKLADLESRGIDVEDFSEYARNHPLVFNADFHAAAKILLVFPHAVPEQRQVYWRKATDGTWRPLPDELRRAIESMDQACSAAFPSGYPDTLSKLDRWPTPGCAQASQIASR